jgi:serine/threonine protein kinase
LFAAKIINKHKYRFGTKASISHARRLHQNELAALQKISHNNIICFHDCFETSSQIVIVTDLCSGGELYEYLATMLLLTEQEVASIVEQVASGLAHCHNLGIIHRDLKPDNLLLKHPRSINCIKIADFGFATLLNDSPSQEQAEKAPNKSLKIVTAGAAGYATSFLGTPGYLAPEVLRRQPYNSYADVWSLGVITYFLLCGELPFSIEHHKKAKTDKNFGQAGSESGDAFESNMTPKYDSPVWQRISESAITLLRDMLHLDPASRCSSRQVMGHSWIYENASTAALVNALAKGKSPPGKAGESQLSPYTPTQKGKRGLKRGGGGLDCRGQDEGVELTMALPSPESIRRQQRQRHWPSLDMHIDITSPRQHQHQQHQQHQQQQQQQQHSVGLACKEATPAATSRGSINRVPAGAGQQKSTQSAEKIFESIQYNAVVSGISSVGSGSVISPLHSASGRDSGSVYRDSGSGCGSGVDVGSDDSGGGQEQEKNPFTPNSYYGKSAGGVQRLTAATRGGRETKLERVGCLEPHDVACGRPI